jgi:hypothetical protein
MIFTPNDNAQLVASVDGSTPTIDYRSELEQLERDRETREIERLMRQRHGVCG